MSTETHAHHEHPDVVGSRNRLGVILILVADIAFALSILFVYFYLRGQNVNNMWLPGASDESPAVLPVSSRGSWILTAIAAFGLLCHYYALKGVRAANQTQLKLGGLVALVAAIAASVMQFNQIANAPFTFSSGAYASCYYLIAILNFVHLALTVFISFGNWNRSRMGLYKSDHWHVDIVNVWWVWMSEKTNVRWLPQYIALGITWGCSFIFIKLGLEFLTPVGVAFVGVALGALTLVTFARIRNIALPRELKTWAHLTFPAMTLNVIPGYLFPVAEQDVTSILAGIINAVTPLMTLIAIMLVFRSEKISKAQVLGLLLGFVGVLTVLGAWRGLGENPLSAVLALLLSVACYGISFPYSRKFILPLGLRPEAAAATQLVIATAILLPFYLMDGIAKDYYRPGPVIAMLCLGIFGRGFAYIWNFQIMAAAGSAIASSVTYVTPVVAVIVGVIFLGEGVTWYEPVGGMIVLLGAAIAQGRIKLSRS